MPDRPPLAPVASVDPDQWADAFTESVRGAGLTRGMAAAWFAAALETGRHYGVKAYLDLVSAQVVGQLAVSPHTFSLKHPHA